MIEYNCKIERVDEDLEISGNIKDLMNITSIVLDDVVYEALEKIDLSNSNCKIILRNAPSFQEIILNGFGI